MDQHEGHNVVALPRPRSVADGMTREVVAIGPQDTFTEIRAAMLTHDVGGLPVVDYELTLDVEAVLAQSGMPSDIAPVLHAIARIPAVVAIDSQLFPRDPNPTGRL